MYSTSILITIILNLIVFCSLPASINCDTWITLWNKLNMPIQIQCYRDGSQKIKKFGKKLLEPDDRYDIKGKYPRKETTKIYRHWCEIKADNVSISFDVFGGKNKKINRTSDSYSDWIINSGGIYRYQKGQLILYYGKNWLGEEHNIENDLAGTPEKELHPEDFVFIAPVEIDLKTAKMPPVQQRYAITKAQYASHKFEDPQDMARYVKAAMKKKFGSFWEVFIEQKMSNKTVKRTCDAQYVINFSVNELLFIVCRVMR